MIGLDEPDWSIDVSVDDWLRDAGLEKKITHGVYILNDVPEGREQIHLDLAEQASLLRKQVLPLKEIKQGNVAASRLE